MVEKMRSSVDRPETQAELEKSRKQQEELKRQIEQGEKSLKQKEGAIVNAVESFNITSFSKKAQSFLKEKNYVSGNKFDLKVFWTWIKIDKNWNLYFGKAFFISKKDVDKFFKNWKFDSKAFKDFLGPWLNKKADEHYTKKSHEAVKNMPKVTTSALSTVLSSINAVQNTFNSIEKAWAVVPAADKKILNDKLYQYNACKDFKNVSEWIGGILSGLEKDCSKKLSINEISNLKWKINRRYQWAVGKKWIYTDKNNKTYDVYNVYKKMSNGEQKYANLVGRVKKLYDKINWI